MIAADPVIIHEIPMIKHEKALNYENNYSKNVV